MSAGGLVPALVITDLHMSGIDGWQFCRLLKSSEYSMCNNVPVLAVSSTFTEFDSTKLAIVEGADAFLKSARLHPMFFSDGFSRLLRGKSPCQKDRFWLSEDSKLQLMTISLFLQKKRDMWYIRLPAEKKAREIFFAA